MFIIPVSIYLEIGFIMANYLFNPRINTYRMTTTYRGYYDHNYTTHYPTSGPDIINPYSNLTNANYAFGRFNEAFVGMYYGLDTLAWRTMIIGRCKTTRLADQSVTIDYMPVSYWYDASTHDTSTITFQNYDYGTRYSGIPAVSDIRFFTIGAYGARYAGIVEKVIDSNRYYISLVDDNHNFHYVYVQNGQTSGSISMTDTNEGIKGYIYTYMNPGDVITMGRPIGWKLPIWAYKKLIDKRR